jgi:hypothetical protein
MISAVARRIDKLEHRFGIAKQPCIVVVATRAGCQLALDDDACVEILRESGFLSDDPLFASVNLLRIPDGLSAEEMERFLRLNGAEICGARSATKPCGPAAHSVRDAPAE